MSELSDIRNRIEYAWNDWIVTDNEATEAADIIIHSKDPNRLIAELEQNDLKRLEENLPDHKKEEFIGSLAGKLNGENLAKFAKTFGEDKVAKAVTAHGSKQTKPEGGNTLAPSAQSSAPGQHFTRLNDIESGPNQFNAWAEGPNPNLAVGGTDGQKEYQRDKTVSLGISAVQSYGSRFVGSSRSPSNDEVDRILGGLNPNSPIGKDGKDITHVIYSSNIPNTTAEEAYRYFVNDPNKVFNAGGMEIRGGPTGPLQDGGRYMLEIGGPVPTWLPIQIKLNDAAHAITIETLDGHVLRGEQTFTFSTNHAGGATLTQDAHFQASSNLTGDLQKASSISNGQHQAWQYAHRNIYEHFNGDSNYQGLGIGLFNKQQIDSWKNIGENTLRQPREVGKGAIEAGGELIDWAIDTTKRMFG